MHRLRAQASFNVFRIVIIANSKMRFFPGAPMLGGRKWGLYTCIEYLLSTMLEGHSKFCLT